MSKREPYGDLNMKGKLYKDLGCGCCVARNGKKLIDIDYMKEYWDEIRELPWDEVKILFQEDFNNDL
jgi:hypothetical protein